MSPFCGSFQADFGADLLELLSFCHESFAKAQPTNIVISEFRPFDSQKQQSDVAAIPIISEEVRHDYRPELRGELIAKLPTRNIGT